jgi:hypothetical protein
VFDLRTFRSWAESSSRILFLYGKNYWLKLMLYLKKIAEKLVNLNKTCRGISRVRSQDLSIVSRVFFPNLISRPHKLLMKIKSLFCFLGLKNDLAWSKVALSANFKRLRFVYKRPLVANRRNGLVCVYVCLRKLKGLSLARLFMRVCYWVSLKFCKLSEQVIKMW